MGAIAAESQGKNGVPATNGNSTNGVEKEKPRRSSSGDDSNTSANRKEVEGIFSKYAQLIHAARRPLPTQSGDGSYLTTPSHGSKLQDLKAIGLKGLSTLVAVKKTKASGDLIDDKTYLMEQIIQVSSLKVTNYLQLETDILKNILACKRFAIRFENQSRSYRKFCRRTMGFPSASSSFVSALFSIWW